MCGPEGRRREGVQSVGRWNEVRGRRRRNSGDVFVVSCKGEEEV